MTRLYFASLAVSAFAAGMIVVAIALTIDNPANWQFEFTIGAANATILVMLAATRRQLRAMI
jgi:hypothetical protein